jgi:dihydrodipicolinate synthase/N-acetylneuraminate lyase
VTAERLPPGTDRGYQAARPIGLGRGPESDADADAPSRYPRTILATCCIPWHNGDEFDEGLFRSGVRRLVADGIHDLYIFGTAGEGHAVTDPLFRAVADAFVDEAQAAQITPMVGVIASSLPTILERIEFAAALGCDLFQVSLPSWGAMLDGEVFAFFDGICGRYPSLRFLHYNVARAGRVLRPGDYVRLASDHPNLVGSKYGGGDPEVIAGLLMRTPMLRHFLTEPGFFTGCAIGGCGLLGSVSTSNPGRALEYFKAGVQRDWIRFEQLHRELMWMMLELRDALGNERRIDGAYDKVIAKVADPEFPLRLLPPWESPSDDAYLRYRSFLEERLPSWIRPSTAQE